MNALVTINTNDCYFLLLKNNLSIPVSIKTTAATTANTTISDINIYVSNVKETFKF